MSHMQQGERELPLPNTPHSYPTLLGMPTHVEASRDPIQGDRPKSNPWTGADQTSGHTIQHVAGQYGTEKIRHRWNNRNGLLSPRK